MQLILSNQRPRESTTRVSHTSIATTVLLSHYQRLNVELIQSHLQHFQLATFRRFLSRWQTKLPRHSYPKTPSVRRKAFCRCRMNNAAEVTDATERNSAKVLHPVDLANSHSLAVTNVAKSNRVKPSDQPTSASRQADFTSNVSERLFWNWNRQICWLPKLGPPMFRQLKTRWSFKRCHQTRLA